MAEETPLKRQSPAEPQSDVEETWRIRDRLRTVSVGIVLCLHLGVDPPDVHKTSPCARLECWTDPEEAKAVETILRNAQQQFEFWHPKARYKTLLDPTTEELRKLCTALRRGAKEERVLLHYNGHGVPRPTKAGELWVFNRQFTQYIPVPATEVAAWLGSPVMVTVDCSAAANMLGPWRRMAEEAGENVLYLASCGKDEILPMTPEMPADIFTACLTTPLEIAIRWHIYRGGPLLPKVTLEMAMSIPGRLNDRKTPLGELNWVLTSVTDGIAWCLLPRDQFQRLFRQDLLVACLFRNYLLAVRILQSFQCTPQSYPPLPTQAIVRHELWNSWDLMLDYYLTLLTPAYNANNNEFGDQRHNQSASTPPHYDADAYFAGQMDTFGIWVDQRTIMQGEVREVAKVTSFIKSNKESTNPNNHLATLVTDSNPSPAESLLPAMLQVLLSQTHRNRALTLLGQYADLGERAILDILQVGIFPYLVKLFQSPATEIRYALLYLWLRVLRLDSGVTVELSRENNFHYFVRALLDPVEETMDVFEMRSMAAACLCLYHQEMSKPSSSAAAAAKGVATALAGDIDCLLTYAQGASPLLSQWSLLLLARILGDNPEVDVFVKEHTISAIFPLLRHEKCENRTAAIHLLGRMLDVNPDPSESPITMAIIYQLLGEVDECHPAARHELVISLSRLVSHHLTKFTLAAFDLWHQFISNRTHPSTENSNIGGNRCYNMSDKTRITVVAPGTGDMVRHPSVFTLVWKACLILSMDPCEGVAKVAAELVDEIHAAFLLRYIVPTTDKKAPSTTESDDILDYHLEDTRKILSTVSLQSPTSTSSTSSSTKTESSTRLYLCSKVINLATDDLIHHQFHRRQMLLRRNAHPINARIRKVSALQSLESRRWRDLPLMERRRFDVHVGPIDVGRGEAVTTVLFHPLDDLVLATDQSGRVSVWDIGLDFKNRDHSRRLTDISLGDVPRNNFMATTARTPITGIACVDWDPIKLLVGTSDGIVRLYRGFEQDSKTTMIAAWSTISTNNINCNTVNGSNTSRSQCTLLEFNQHQRRLFTVAGGSELTILDAAREQIMQRIILPAVPATALTSDRRESPIVTVGFADGFIRRYDLRQGERAIDTFRGPDPLTFTDSSSGGGSSNTIDDIMTWNAVMGVKQSFRDHELVSSTIGGVVVHWDLRQSLPLLRISDTNTAPLTALDQHPEAHLQIIGGVAGSLGTSSNTTDHYNNSATVSSSSSNSSNHNNNVGGIISWWEGEQLLQSIQNHGGKGLLATRMAPVRSVAVHPRRMLVALGCSDGFLSLHTASFT